MRGGRVVDQADSNKLSQFYICDIIAAALEFVLPEQRLGWYGVI